MRFLFALVAAGALASGCGDDSGPRHDGGSNPDLNASADLGGVDLAHGADLAHGDGSMTLSSCLEAPGSLPRPPSGGLPCELIPPSF